MEEENFYPISPEIEVQQLDLIQTGGIELTIEDNECDDWYPSFPEAIYENP